MFIDNGMSLQGYRRWHFNVAYKTELVCSVKMTFVFLNIIRVFQLKAINQTG